MSLTGNSLLIAAFATVLGIVGEWAAPHALPLWRVVVLCWICGLVYEWLCVRGLELAGALESADRLFLGRASEISLRVGCSDAHDLRIEYVPGLPPWLATGDTARVATMSAGKPIRETFEVLPRRLGRLPWQSLPARVRGRFGLAWWSHPIDLGVDLRVLPDTLRTSRGGPIGSTADGVAQRAAMGGGSELLQIRSYRPGDPRRTLDWKATARSGRLMTRTFSEDQHLEIVVAIDAGRTSRIESGGMSHLAHYANLAARFAEYAVLNEDRVGLVVFADRPLVSLAPARGTGCVLGIRRALAELRPLPVESDAVAAILHLRRLVRHRSLVVLLTDLYERSASSQLAETVRVLRPTHVPMIVGLVGDEVSALAAARAETWLDPYRSLAATEYQRDVRANTARLCRMGAFAVASRPADLTTLVFERYRTLRNQRRI